MSFTFAKLAVAVAALATGCAASAAQVTQWDFVVNSTFDAANTVYSSGVPNSSGSTSALELSWGRTDGTVGGNRSGLRISNTPSAGVLTTDGDSKVANTYTHINNGNLPLNSVSLLSTQINAQLQLRPAGSGLPYATYLAPYTINFAETLNDPGTCVVVSAVACDDIFVLAGSLNESFTFDGFKYFVSFFAAPSLVTLDPAVCAAAGAGPNCIGFTTQEFQSTSVNFNLVITSEAIQVPEPGSLALLGLGLFGIGAMQRRRQA